MNFSSFIALAWRSLSNRRATALLTIFTVALSVTLFLGVDKIRRGTEAGFKSTVSGTDVIVGARTGEINLLLFSVFRIGNPTSNVSWESYEHFGNDPLVDWTIPMSLGDSHKGFRVLGTDQNYFDHYRYGSDRALILAQGERFEDAHDAVVGATVAKELGYEVGDEIVISHGIVSAGFANHDEDPFTIVGIFAPTGTPVDRTVHVSLEGLEAVHGDGDHDGESEEEHAAHAEPDALSAFMMGLNVRAAAPRLVYNINQYEEEPLSAIMPGSTIQQLWVVVGAAERALRSTAAFVVITGLLCLLTAILTSLNERRREIAVLRAAGARRGHIFSLLVMESTLIAFVGAIIGVFTVYGLLSVVGPLIESRYGVPIADLGPSIYDAAILGLVVFAATILGMVPAWRAYKNSLADGLTVKL